MKKYSIGLDLGTSSVKGILFDGENVLYSHSAKFNLKECRLNDDTTYVGFNADEYAETVFQVIAEISKIVNGDVFGIAMASASGNTVLLDKDYRPVIDAFSWTSSGFEKEIKAVYGELDSKKVADISGWGFYNSFPLAHLAFIKAHNPQLLSNSGKICMSTEYILFLLTGKWGIDVSTAVPFYLLEQTTGKWHKEYLDKLAITERQLPKVYESGYFLGNITENLEKKVGVNRDCRVYLGSFDHPSGAIANNVINEGDLLLSCGTSWVCFFPCKDRQKVIQNGLLCDTFLSRKNGTWGAMFSVEQISKPIEQMLNKYFSENDTILEFNLYSERAKKGADGLKINPATDAENDLSSYSKENIARAIMEGAAQLFKTKLDELEHKGFVFNSVKMAGGPSQSKIWREIIEYTIGKKVTVIYGINSGAVGAVKRFYEKNH